MTSRTFLISASLAWALAGSYAAAAETAIAAPAASSAPAAAWTAGEVRHVDTQQGKVTLEHGDIVNLGMPGMTMIFKASDPTMLSGLEEGDKVRFKAVRVNGALTVTAIEPAH